MGRLAQATRMAKARMRNAAQDTKALVGTMKPEQLKDTIAFLMRARRLLPRPGEVTDLKDEVDDSWDPPDADTGEKPAKGQDSKAKGSGDGKKDMLRAAVLTLKRAHKVAKQIVVQAKQGDEALALLRQPSMALLRAPVPTARFTTAQMDEMLGLILLLARLVERYAKKMKAG